MDPYLGEIRMFAGSFVPAGWQPCDGSLLNINQFTALYSLLGVTYGGDGRSTFALPDLRGRFVVHRDPAVGLQPGTTGGSESVTVLTAQLPPHDHALLGSAAAATATDPAAGTWASAASPPFVPGASAAPAQAMSPASLEPAGGSQPHENRPPYTVVWFGIATTGLYPARP
jgi:microcystin-dependent protein